MRESEEARCSGRADGVKERGRERKSDGKGKTERAEKLMSRLLCDGACLLQCQAAFLHTHLKTLLAFFHSPRPFSFSVLFLCSLSHFLAFFLSDSMHYTDMTSQERRLTVF